MDYKELAESAFKHAKIFKMEGELSKAAGLERYATAITDLLARAEAAEAERDKLKEKLRLASAALKAKVVEIPDTTEDYLRKAEINAAVEIATFKMKEQLKEADARAEKSERYIAELMGISPQERITTCFGHPLDRVRELVEADRDGRVKILPKSEENTCGTCGRFRRITSLVYAGTCDAKIKCRNMHGQEEERRGLFVTCQSGNGCRQYVSMKGEKNGKT